MNSIRAFLFVPSMSAADLALIILLNVFLGLVPALILWTIYVWFLRNRVIAFFLPPLPEDEKPKD